VWEETKAEINQGVLQGAFLQAELAKQLGPLFLTSKRFGVRQGDQSRPIDDLAAGLVCSGYRRLSGSCQMSCLSGQQPLAFFQRLIRAMQIVGIRRFLTWGKRHRRLPSP
jgi:hypothetical protein